MIDDILSLVLASIAAFVATSLDNLVLLAGFRTSGPARRGTVGGAYFSVVLVVALLSLGVAAATDDLIPFPLGWLGLAPITIGVWTGVQTLRRGSSPESGDAPARDIPVGFAGVFATMLANSGDSLIVFTALQGDTRSWLDAVACATFLSMAILWAWLSRVVTRHPRVRGPLESFGRFGLPILLVSVGIYILLDTPSDALGS